LIRYSETKLWNIHTGNLLRTLPGCRLDAISPDGRIIASSGSDSGTEPWNIYIRDIYTRKLLKILSGHFGGVSCLAFSCDGQTLASGSYASEGGTLKVWNLNTGKVICTIYRNVGKSVFSVAISPDGQTLASIEAEQIIIWNLYTGELLRTFYYSGYSECVAFSLDGKILAGGSEGDTIMLWHPQTGELLSTLSGQEGDVLSIAFSSDGQTLASASSENIKIWDVYTGELLHTLTGNSNSVESIAFSPDGLTLVSGCSIYDEEMDDDYGIIEIWRLSA
jgi:WD40 repeat protein